MALVYNKHEKWTTSACANLRLLAVTHLSLNYTILTEFHPLDLDDIVINKMKAHWIKLLYKQGNVLAITGKTYYSYTKSPFSDTYIQKKLRSVHNNSWHAKVLCKGGVRGISCSLLFWKIKPGELLEEDLNLSKSNRDMHTSFKK